MNLVSNGRVLNYWRYSYDSSIFFGSRILHNVPFYRNRFRERSYFGNPLIPFYSIGFRIVLTNKRMLYKYAKT